MELSPNPGNGDFTVGVDPRSTSAAITMRDAAGRVVLQRRIGSVLNGSVHIDARNVVVPGVYRVRCSDGFTVTEHRLVVQ